MQVTLTPETAAMVEQRLKEGTYASAAELLQAAMQALDNQQFEPLDEETLAAIDEAEDDIERGDVFPLEEVEDQIRAMFSKGR